MANPTLLSVPLCRDAEKNTIPVTDNGTTGKFSEQYGWQGINSLPLSAGGKAVERLDFNGVLALLGGIDYMTQRGYTFEYDNSLPYVVGCIVVDPLDGKTYRCINDVPIGASNPSNDTINWVSHDIADYVGGALRGKAYNVGDTSTLVGIPAGYFLECTTAGTTGATAPVVTTVTVGQTITDGSAVWTVRRAVCEADYPKTSFGTAVVNHLLGSTLASLVSAVSTDSLFSKLLKKALEAAGLQYSMGTNGYICLGSLFGDAILQWGTTGAIAVNTSDSITMLINFSNTKYSINATNNSSRLSAGNIVGLQKNTPNTFNYYIKSSESYTSAFSWFAIGH
jgi:hypothetical protein